MQSPVTPNAAKRAAATMAPHKAMEGLDAPAKVIEVAPCSTRGHTVASGLKSWAITTKV
ncbi:hypothetical protein MesoLj113a_65040 [Mesorhizobium sp. 113-1-2]|nr:hypothetical protein MesoLj113a_65040 [Mesorhizobium sp. 113-1-2]